MIPYLGFILAAYAVCIAVIIGLIVWVFADYRAQKRTLAELERRGVRRRSARAAGNAIGGGS